MSNDYMNGWDTMVATSQANVNKALVLAYNDDKLPHHATGAFTIKMFGMEFPAYIDADLGPWNLAGGSGKLVIVEIPFTGGTMTIGNITYPLAGVLLDVTCLLTEIKSPIEHEDGSSDYIFQINFVSPDAIQAVQVKNPPPGIDQNTIDIVLLNFLKETLGGNTYDIATVNLNGAQQDYAYIIPTLCEYAIDTNTADPNSSVFGFQMLTINTVPGNQDIARGTIPVGTPTCDSAVLLSNQIFVQYILMPGIVSSLGVSADHLMPVYNAGSWQVVNNGDITLNMDYNPVLSSFNAVINNNLLDISLTGHVEASPGITINFNATATYQLQLTNSGTTQTLDLVQVSHDSSTSVDVATWVYITTAGLAALMTLVMGPIAGGLVAAVEALIVYIVATVANNKAGELLANSLPLTISSNVTWTYMEVFTIEQALMPMPLQLGGIIPVLNDVPTQDAHATVGAQNPQIENHAR
ncbi:MAG TPA: TULIP family P47-like protein [Ktedonosporobacter sp.]|jgi:hypothetical protein|nr:TULIP family P47-like protein [Ktedonosporobacter sp.]